MVIIIHGGAGTIKNIKRRREVIIKACKIGYEVLKNGGEAIDAVTSAVVELEDSPWFNAGTGAATSVEGEVELDSAVMRDDLGAGAVACIKDVKNPILVARKVMEETDHVLLSGEGATRFAKLMGFPQYNPLTPRRKRLFKTRIKKLREGKPPKYLPKLKEFMHKYSGCRGRFQTRPYLFDCGTVGACAIDKNHRLASATSTGGLFMHLPGRVGDTPLIGAGTYANGYGAVSCTGYGECIIKLCLAKITCEQMKNLPSQEAVNFALKIASNYGCKCGLIGIDKKANVGFGFNTPQMMWAYIKEGEFKHF